MVKRCWWLVVVISFGACFSPSFTDNTIQCGPNGECPPGLDCVAGVCRTANGSDTMAPPAPMLTSVTPTSPANNNSPVIVGSAEAGATIRIFSDAACMTEVGTGTAAALASPGIGITVGDDSTSSFAATARDAVGNTSPCSAALAYVEDSTPPSAPAIASTVPPSPSRSVLPSVRGTAEVGATVLIYGNASCGGTMLASGAVDGAGAFAITTSVPASAITQLAGVTRDAAGNVSTCSSFISYEQNAAAVVIPAFTTTTPASPSNTSTTPMINGTSEAGVVVRLYTNSSCSGTAAGMANTNSSGAFSVGVTVGTNSTSTFYGVAEDTSVTAYSACSLTGITYVHDAMPPVAPAVSGSTPASPSNSTTPVITGTAEVGANVGLFTNSSCTGTATATGTATTSGTFGIAVTLSAPTTYYAKATDAAGNVSPCSTVSYAYAFDGVAPGAPTALGTLPGSPSTTSNTPFVSGMAEALSTVRIYRTANCMGPEAGSGSSSSMTFGIGITVPTNTTSALSATATDAAGNTSPCSTSINYVHDNLVPSPPLFTTSTPASPSNVNSPTISGTAEAGTIVQLYTDSLCATTIGSTGVATSGMFAIPISVSPDTTTQLFAKATDGAGNISTCSTSSFTYDEDSTPPGAPVITALAPSSTNTMPALNGSGLSGATIKLYATANCSGSVVAMGPATGGSFSITVTVSANTTTPFSATATDSAGNPSPCSASINYIHDNLVPNVPTGLASNPVSPAGSNTPQITGSADPNITVRLFTNAGCSSAIAGFGTATGGGTFAIPVTVSNGSVTTFYATAVDAANNESACTGINSFVTYTHDAIPPAPPTSLATTPGSPSMSTMPSVTGNAEAASTVRLYTNNQCTGTAVAMGVTNGSGSFSIPTTVSPNAPTTFWATASDGTNTSTCSTSNVVYVNDGMPPGTPRITASSPASPANNNTPQLSGTAEAGSLVSIWTSSNCSTGLQTTITAAPAGTYGVDVTVLDNTTTIFYASAKDAAGNISLCSDPFTYQENSLVVQTPTLTSTTPTSPTNGTTSPTLNGNAGPSNTVRIFTNALCTGGTQIATTTANATTGLFGVAVVATANMTTTYYANATDGVTTSGCSAGFAYVHDTGIPAPPSALFVTPASPANNNDPVVGGNAEGGTTITLYVKLVQSDPDCTGTVVGTGTSIGGTFSVVTSSVANNSTTTWFGTATDAAGNVSACSAGLTYVEDSNPPAMPTVVSTTPTSPNSSTTPFVNGSAEVGGQVAIFTTPDCTGSPAGVSGTLVTSAYSISVSVGANSTTTFKALAADAAGNISACSSTSVTYVQDSNPPGVPTLSSILPTGPANNNVPVVSGSTNEVGVTIRLHTDSFCSSAVIGTGTSGTGGGFNVTANVIDNSITSIYATATDASNNTSGCSLSSLTYQEDSQAPDKPFNLSTNPTSPSSSNTLDVKGSAEDGATVKVYTTLGCTGTFVSRVVSGGVFAVPTTVGTDTVTDFYLTATDVALNTSGCSEKVTYREDSTALPPTLTSTNPTSPSSTSTTPALNGLAEAASTVSLYTAAGCTAASLVTSGTADAAGGFQITTSVSPNTSTTFYARYVDLANNTSACSSGLTYVHDDMRPTFAGATSAVATGPNSILVSWASATDNFTLASNMRYELCASNVPDGCAIPNFTILATTAPGATSFSMGGLNASQRFWIRVRAVDQANNKSFPTVEVTDRTFGSGSTTEISAGYTFACALGSDGLVRCWGAGINGQLGHGSSPTESLTPVIVTGLNDVVSVSAGGHAFSGSAHACAVKSDGTVWCWGYGANGQTGDGLYTTSNVPVRVNSTGTIPLTQAIQVSVGGQHSCALISNGTIRCWGHGTNGQIGNGLNADQPFAQLVSGGFSTFVAVQAGHLHTCGLLAAGMIKCWGLNTAGQLGFTGSSTNAPTSNVSLSAGDIAKQIDVGGYHACAVLQNGQARCWGSNVTGQLGNGSTNTGPNTPVAVKINAATNLTSVKSISAGGAYISSSYFGTSCATLADGTARCWGYNGWGQVGNGNTATPQTLATPVVNANNVVAASVGDDFSCGLGGNGTVQCFGLGASGRLGTGNTADSSSPVAVQNLFATEGGVQLAGGMEGSTMCARVSNGRVYCWGENANGQLGFGSATPATRPYPFAPVQTSSGAVITNAIDVDYSTYYGCLLRSDGSVVCWGANESGQLGNGTTIAAPTGGVVVLAAAASGSPETQCDGQDNDVDGIVDDGCPLPNAIQIATGYNHSCAVISDGTIKCWGLNNYYQLGDGTTTTALTPVTVAGVSNAIKVHAQGSTTCAVRSNGTVSCWGYDYYGMCGDGTSNTTFPYAESAPVSVLGVASAKSLGAASITGCAVLADGTAKCWGYGGNGQIGNGTNATFNPSPATVGSAGGTALTGITGISGGAYHLCAVVVDASFPGRPRCWGDNGFGPIGDGTSGFDRLEPTIVTGMATTIDIAGGGYTSCGLHSDGTAECWGRGDQGALGDGNSSLHNALFANPVIYFP